MFVLGLAMALFAGVAGADPVYTNSGGGALYKYDTAARKFAGSYRVHPRHCLSPVEFDGDVYFGTDGDGLWKYDLTWGTATRLSAAGSRDAHAIDIDTAGRKIFVFGGGNKMRRYGLAGKLEAESADLGPVIGAGNYLDGQDVEVFGTDVYFCPGQGNGAPFMVLKMTGGTTFTAGSSARIVFQSADLVAAGFPAEKDIRGFCIGPDGSIYAGTGAGRKVYVKDPRGRVTLFCTIPPGDSEVWDVDYHGGRIYTSGRDFGVRVYDMTGRELARQAIPKGEPQSQTWTTEFGDPTLGLPVAVPVPEPAGLALQGAALLGAALLGLRKRRS